MMNAVAWIQSGVIVLDINIRMKQSTCHSASAPGTSDGHATWKGRRMGSIELKKA
jgi:hypothetical protein